MCSRQVLAWWWILLYCKCSQVLTQAATSLARPRQTYLEEIRCWEGGLPGCKCWAGGKKCIFKSFLAPLGEKCLWRRPRPGAEHLFVKKRWWGMNCRAHTEFPGSGFAQQPSPQNRLVWSPRQPLPVSWGGGGDKISATTFFKPGKYSTCTLNSEMKAKCRCCRGEIGALPPGSNCTFSKGILCTKFFPWSLRKKIRKWN